MPISSDSWKNIVIIRRVFIFSSRMTITKIRVSTEIKKEEKQINQEMPEFLHFLEESLYLYPQFIWFFRPQSQSWNSFKIACQPLGSNVVGRIPETERPKIIKEKEFLRQYYNLCVFDNKRVKQLSLFLYNGSKSIRIPKDFLILSIYLSEITR